MKLLSAEKAKRGLEPRRVDPNNREHAILLRLAQDAEWLLKENTSTPGPRRIRQMNREIAIERGFTSDRGIIRNPAWLREEFDAFCPEPLRRRLGCEFRADSDRCWLIELFRPSDCTPHPVRQLLLMQFLGVTAKSFVARFDAPAPINPATIGPWPCLNVTSACYRQNTIHTYKLDRQRPVGIFHCPKCLYTYSRWLDGRAGSEDVFKALWVLDAGPVWREKLRSMLADPKLSIPKIAAALGMSMCGILGRATRFHLFPDSGPRAAVKRPIETRRRGERHAATLEEHKQVWLAARARWPALGNLRLQEKTGPTYVYLHYYVPGWLRENSGPKGLSRRSRHAERLAKEESLVFQIGEAAKQLKLIQGRPKRVTAGAIRTRLRKILSPRQIAKMPRVAETLSLVTESDEMLALRRVEWALSEAAGRRDMTRNKFVRLAEIRPMRKLPKVASAVSAALAQL